VFDDTENVNGAECMLRNCVDADSVEDPIPAVEALLKRCSTESLMTTYAIPNFPKGNVMVFLAMIAKRNGRVLKGGIPDKIQAARSVLKDWNTGKIPFYTRPPTEEEYRATKSTVENDAQIVSAFSKAFDVNKMDNEVLGSLENKDEMDFVQMAPDEDVRNKNSSKVTEAAVNFLIKDENSDDDIEMDDEEDANASVGTGKTSVLTNDAMTDAEDVDFS
jgi:nuclear GTP-binding protein